MENYISLKHFLSKPGSMETAFEGAGAFELVDKTRSTIRLLFVLLEKQKRGDSKMRNFIATVLEWLDYLELFTSATRKVAKSTIEIINQLDDLSTALEKKNTNERRNTYGASPYAL